MFAQVIQGKVSDPEGFKRQIQRWKSELMNDAPGFLGETFGVTKDGQAIGIPRFKTEAEARRNSNRPEQTAWWNETEKYFDGKATFHDSTNVEETMDGGSDDAGFVQVMQGRFTDLDKLHKLEKDSEALMRKERPDCIGSVRAIYDDNEYTEAIYFTSEKEARANEAKQLSPEAAEMFSEWQSAANVDKYFDLTDPWLISP